MSLVYSHNRGNLNNEMSLNYDEDTEKKNVLSDFSDLFP